MNQSLLLPAAVYSTFGNDPDMAELVDLFVQELPARVANFRDCMGRNDLEALGRAAHQLKGSAGSYGFGLLTPSLQRLESLAKERAALKSVQDALDEVTDVCARVRPGAPQDQ